MRNPWLGLSSYSEESLKEHQFNGRSTAIATLTTLIRQNLFVTLYGRSGIGKTSLLQAGVYPLLKRDSFSPITIRLNNLKDNDDSAAKEIWAAISNTLSQNGYRYTPCDVKDEYIPDYSDILVFRKLFSAGRFLNQSGQEAIPVLVLDQFEEILYNSPKLSRLLISQLYALIDDNYNLGVSHPYWHDDTNFRIVISIREDDLFLFEDNIDSLNCVDFKSNRFRLMPLSESEAMDIILNPILNKQIFEVGNEIAIAKEIINLSKGNGQNVNTLLLSLICYVLYEDCAKQGKQITPLAIASYNDIIETYYTEVTKGLPKEQRYYLEDHLIDNQGRRSSIYLSDLEKYAPQAKLLLENSSHRILNENQGRVEFIHDQLAVSIMKLRDSRKSIKAKQIGIIVLIILLAGAFLFSFSRVPGERYDYASSLINDTEVSHISIKDTTSRRYEINDCPALKSIDIEVDIPVFVYNCPSLLNISLPKDYTKHVYVRNCPYVKLSGDRIIEHSYVDTLLYERYKSQYPHGIDTVFYNQNQTFKDRFFNYDSVSKALIVKRLPVAKTTRSRTISGPIDTIIDTIGIGYLKYATYLTDSIKKETICYVPRGYKNKFLYLEEYKPFKSIEEMSVLYTWRTNTNEMFIFFKNDKQWLNLTIIGLFFVQCFFWIIALNEYRFKNKNILVAIGLSFIYGVGMSLLATLSFMSFYWTFYYIILSEDQLIATLCGVIGCILCMGIVYKNAFYSLTRYLKANGIKGLFKDIKGVILDLPKQIKICHNKLIEKCTNIRKQKNHEVS